MILAFFLFLVLVGMVGALALTKLSRVIDTLSGQGPQHRAPGLARITPSGTPPRRRAVNLVAAERERALTPMREIA